MNSLLANLQRGANLIGALFFMTIFLLFLLQIAARYIFGWPLGWPDEAISFLFIWVAFWGGALMVPIEKQISFDLLHEILPPIWQKATEISSLATAAILLVAAVPITADFILFSHRQTTSVLELPLSVVYAPVLLFILATIFRLCLRILTLMRHRGIDHP